MHEVLLTQVHGGDQQVSHTSSLLAEFSQHKSTEGKGTRESGAWGGEGRLDSARYSPLSLGWLAPIWPAEVHLCWLSLAGMKGCGEWQEGRLVDGKVWGGKAGGGNGL